MINPPNGQTSNFGSDDKSPKLSNSKSRMDDKSTQWSNINFLVDDKSTKLSNSKIRMDDKSEKWSNIHFLGWMINPQNGQTSNFGWMINPQNRQSLPWTCFEILEFWRREIWISQILLGHVLGLDLLISSKWRLVDLFLESCLVLATYTNTLVQIWRLLSFFLSRYSDFYFILISKIPFVGFASPLFFFVARLRKLAP